MRVISGMAGGLRLEVPKQKVRPTMDRVKAAIFSSLGEVVLRAGVLDLFAGTGALGIEALSRGAASASFVDEDGAAVAAIERNLAKAKLSGRVVRQNVFTWLRRGVTSGQFDIIFADPPYERTTGGEAYTDLLLSSTHLPEFLAPSGIFILEKRPAEEISKTNGWEIVRAKRYGATEVVFFQRVA